MAFTWTGALKGYFLRTSIYLFNFVYFILCYCGIDILPLTFEKVIKPLTPEQREEASRPDFSVPLEYFLNGFRKNPQTTGFQRFMILSKVRGYAIQRAAVKNEIKKNPDILKTPVENPLVIIGLPRTGTTMLQRMMSKDPQLLSPMMWEVMTPPVPPGRPPDFRNTDRYKNIKQFYKFREWLGLTAMDKRHKLGVELEEECLMILKAYFISLGDAIPDGFEELRNFLYNYPAENQHEAYAFYKHSLQCMFYNNLDGSKRLLLKAPIHILFLDTYLKVLPGAKFIFTYRDFKEITASLCSLMYEFGKESGFTGDRIKHGEKILEFLKNLSYRIVPFLKKLPQDSYIILGYTELMSDPLSAARKIYNHFGLPFTQGVENAMEVYMKENPIDRFGTHEYNLNEWGITKQDIKETFKELQEYLDDLSSSRK